jgi:DNA-binding response OmpR family regulator
MKQILIVEDDKSIAELERDYLEAADFEVTIAGDGRQGLELAQSGEYDLLLLDVMLPGVDGFQICREVRKTREIPILMVSARREDIDKIRGLGLGADDYIIKPFSPSELTARVKAHLSRYERLLANSGKQLLKSIQCGDLEIQPDTHRVYLAGKEISLTNREFELLLFLSQNPGIVFSKDRLFERVWGLDAAGDTATVMVHVNRLREKIEPEPSKPIYIETVWGAGYRFHG